MKIFSAFVIASALFLAGCGKSNKVEAPEGKQAYIVEEIIPAASYLYVRGINDGKEVWMAVSKMDLVVGDTLFFAQAMEMKNFKSPTIDKEFASIFFISDPVKGSQSSSGMGSGMGGGMMGSGQPHPSIQTEGKADVKIEKPAGGFSIGEIYSGKANLSGKTVKVKGKVVKVNVSIMDRNWVHIQDGTEADGKFDLLITTAQEAAVGDVIEAEGTLILDKDFGSGYKYDVLVQDAKLTKSN
ncbi:MAG: hypothetical protein L6Q59_08020 [Ignavibacteriaceae bacterium]|nr:hypothetical protein [Ignavibacteriaceae bacterium]